MTQGALVADHDQAILGARDGDVGPAPVRQKANVAAAVGAHGGEDDGRLLAPLEAVHALALHGAHLWTQAAPQHTYLRAVRRHNTNFLHFQAASEQPLRMGYRGRSINGARAG